MLNLTTGDFSTFRWPDNGTGGHNVLTGKLDLDEILLRGDTFRREVFKCYANQKFQGNATFQDFVRLRINVWLNKPEIVDKKSIRSSISNIPYNTHFQILTHRAPEKKQDN